MGRGDKRHTLKMRRIKSRNAKKARDKRKLAAAAKAKKKKK